MSMPAADSTASHDQRRDTCIFLLLMWAVAVFSLCLAWGINSLSTDDAMRLVEVRDLLAGQSWFDMTQYRLDAPGGVVSHWSRLVDLPLALIIKSVSIFASTAFAEKVALIAWPTALLLVFLAGVSRLARELGGHAAARLALVLAVLMAPVLQNFRTGAIHHHNVQTRFDDLGVGFFRAHAVAAARCRRCGFPGCVIDRGRTGNGACGRSARQRRRTALDHSRRRLQARDRGLRRCAGRGSGRARCFDGAAGRTISSFIATRFRSAKSARFLSAASVLLCSPRCRG